MSKSEIVIGIDHATETDCPAFAIIHPDGTVVPLTQADYDTIKAAIDAKEASEGAQKLFGRPPFDIAKAAESMAELAKAADDIGREMRRRLEPDPEALAKLCSQVEGPKLNRAQRRAKKRGK